jgi:predicted AlkP superfamily phosphohydrolase/phosphomutase/tetratricopeptide (TPR) repeat protein
MSKPKRKVLVIGWDAADWKAIDPIMDQGLMPNLERLVNGGVRGRIATLDPPLSPMLWTSIATGKRPYKHGILGFTEVGPDGAVRPITNRDRKVKAIWNILTQQGLRSHVIGWWPSHPAEPINGTMISNFYQRATRPINEPWVMREGTVHPADKSLHYGDLRIHPAELTAAHIAPFIPDFAQVDQTKEKVLETVATLLADCSTVHAAATWILEKEEWDFVGVYYDAIDHFKHAFMKFHPPRRPHIPEREFELYKGVVQAAYQYHDLMLGRLLELAGEDATVMLLSDHGFHPDHLRPLSVPKEPAGPAVEHSPFGIFCLNGPGIKKDELVHGAGLLDITPTLLTLFGLPVGADMDGKPLLDVFEAPPELEVIPSWEAVDGECGMHPPASDGQAFADMDKESLAQLVELGYIEDPGEAPAEAGARTVRENRFHLAKAYLDGGRVQDALEQLFDLFDEAPEQQRYARELIRALLLVRRAADARSVHERALLAQEKAHEEKRTSALEKKGEEEGKDLGPFVPSGNMRALGASIMEGEGRYREALAELERLALRPGMEEKLQLRIGQALAKLGRWKQALEAFGRAVRHDPRSVSAHQGQGLCLLKMGRAEEAADELLEAVALRFETPLAHYHLGEAYYRMGLHAEALQAFQVVLRMAPGMNKARLRMARLYEDHLARPDLAEQLRAQVKASAEEKVITVVSGLPRSGTSMMMQALVAGGLEPFTDAEREADESNPKGYFEHRAVKALASDNRFMADAVGRVVKVVAPLLPFLPSHYTYKVVFMERHMDEVLLSQNRMIERQGRSKADGAFRVGLEDAFRTQLEKVGKWQTRSPSVQVLRVPYHEALGSTHEVMERVNTFLGGELDVEAMVASVDPSLYRSRNTDKADR